MKCIVYLHIVSQFTAMSTTKPDDTYAVRAFTHKKVERAVEIEQSNRLLNKNPRKTRMDIVADVLEAWADTVVKGA